MVTIIFESHGTTFDNESDLSSGIYDVALSPLGEQQARELGERYKSDYYDAIFCSNLQRSYKTAEIAFADRNFKIIKDPRLKESNYGDFTRRSYKEVKALRLEYVDKPFPNGDSYEQKAQEIKNFLQDLLKNYDDKKVMIIGHRATQYGLELWIKGVPLKEAVIAPWKWQPGWVYNLEKI
jgi:broad specificity phosphatase PhoE